MPARPSSSHDLMAETLSASGKESERLSLPALQSKMKCDPEGYESELLLLRRHFISSLNLFRSHSALAPSSDATVAKDLGDLAMLLSHLSPFYPSHLSEFPAELMGMLRSGAASLPSSLRRNLTRALILLVNRKFVDMEDTLELFMSLQVIGDQILRKLAFSHVVHHIRRMNQKHKNDPTNRKLQNILFSMLDGEDELKAKRALAVLCDLHRRRIWLDDRTANAICSACLLTSSKIMISALKFILGYEQVAANDSNESDDEDDTTVENVQITVNKEAVYKAHHKGTVASKKKKKAKLQRVIRSMKRQQRLSSNANTSNWYSPVMHLKDAQGFSEKLFSRLQKCNERFEDRMMMLKVIARTVGLHKLILLNLYPYFQNYVKPGQSGVLELLAAAVQACHDMVPPDAVEPLFRQIVNDYVHDRSRPEAIAVGLNVTREICLRMPLLMNEDLLQDLVLYKKSHEKAISTAARSLMVLFREICPSLLIKKDRGRPVNPSARPKAFGEVNVACGVPGAELLELKDRITTHSSDEAEASDIDGSCDQCDFDSDAVGSIDDSEEEKEEKDEEDEEGEEDDEEEDDDLQVEAGDDKNYDVDDDIDIDNCDTNNVKDEDMKEASHRHVLDDTIPDARNEKNSGGQKRKFADFVQHINVSDKSLRALKRLVASKTAKASSDINDGFFSNDDFQRIKDLKAKKEAKMALARQGVSGKVSDSSSSGFKLPSSEQLSLKRVDPAELEVNIKRKMSKEERLALVKAGREERGTYHARIAVKQKKTGGSSNRQKEHKKAMPLAAKRSKIARSRQEKKKQQRRSGKQFRGRKAWK